MWGELRALAADDDDIKVDWFPRLMLGHCDGHLGLDWMRRRDSKARRHQRLKDGLPSFRPRVVVGEDKNPIILQNAVCLRPYREQPFGEGLDIGILNFVFATSGVGFPMSVWTEDMPLPDVEKIGKLRVVDVVKKRRVRNDRIDCPVRQISRAWFPQDRYTCLPSAKAA